MSGYGQFCPVAKASEVLCRQWTPLILRELLLGSRRYGEVRRGVPRISPSLLSRRLRELEAAGVLVHADDGGYDLTEAGRELYPIVQAMGEWGQRWARSDYGRDELDPGVLLWDVRRFLAPDGLGTGRHVVAFEFPRQPAGRRRYWVVADESGVDVCLVDPGFPVDAVVRGELRALTEVWMGDSTFGTELRRGRLEVDAPTRLRRRVPEWFGRHPVLADVASAR